MTTVYRDRWHFSVGDKKYHNKFEAIEHNIRNGESIHFHGPEAYVNYDFSHEPTEDLMTLLQLHAVRIRENHSKVRMYYSGGADGDLMLRAFMKAKVFIDEIICWKCGIPPADFEIDQYAIPRLKALDLPGTKITVSETTMEDYVTYYQEGVTQKKLNNGIYNYNTHIRLLEQNELFRQEIKSKDIANIRGMDKPKIIKHNGLTYAYLLDVDLEPNPHTINFFSDDPAIQSKQSHLLLKSDESIGRKHPGIDFPAKRLLYDDDAFMTFKGKIIRYANVKEKIALNYLKDENPKIIDLWYQNIEHLSQHTNGKWWNKESPELSTIGVFSELHCLDHHETKKIEQLYPKGFRND